MRIGALEAGGTKMVCAIGNEKGEILERESFPTETPEITLPKLVAYFEERNVEALGIGCFGPIDLHQDSDTYGYITTTPKIAWQNCNIVGAFEKLQVPIGFDTDVNESVLPALEERWGKPGIELVENKELWEMEAYYIAQALVDYVMMLSPQKIILGGGVMHQEQLFPLIREKFKEMLNGYIDTKELENLDNYIVPPYLEDNQGIMGAIQLALLALDK